MMSQKLLDHGWHSDTSWEQLPAWIRGSARNMDRLRHGEELVGRNVRYRVVGRTLMRRLRYRVPVITASQQASDGDERRSVMSTQLPYNVTKQSKGGSVLSRNAKALHNRYQTEVDNAHTALVNEIHHVEGVNRRKALDYRHQAQELQEGVKAHLDEFNSLEATLDVLLTKDFGQEYTMWKENTQGLNIRTTEGFKSDVTGVLGYVTSAPTLKYLERYPEHSSHPSVQANRQSLESKIRDVRMKVESHNRVVSGFNHELPFYAKNVQKCQDNLERYRRILQEGNDRIGSCYYVKSFLFRVLPEDKKMEILIDTLKHPMEKWENVIKMFQEDLSRWQQQPFEELAY